MAVCSVSKIIVPTNGAAFPYEGTVPVLVVTCFTETPKKVMIIQGKVRKKGSCANIPRKNHVLNVSLLFDESILVYQVLPDAKLFPNWTISNKVRPRTLMATWWSRRSLLDREVRRAWVANRCLLGTSSRTTRSSLRIKN